MNNFMIQSTNTTKTVDGLQHEIANTSADNDLKHVDTAVRSENLDGVLQRLEVFDTVRELKHVGAAVNSRVSTSSVKGTKCSTRYGNSST